MAYKYHTKKSLNHLYNSNDDPDSRMTGNSCDGDFKLLWKKTFPDPIHAVDTVDATGDGLTEVALVSAKGLHLLQVARGC